MSGNHIGSGKAAGSTGTYDGDLSQC
jgi:hypothetical protein